jgi:hypothetical protein
MERSPLEGSAVAEEQEELERVLQEADHQGIVVRLLVEGVQGYPIIRSIST